MSAKTYDRFMTFATGVFAVAIIVVLVEILFI